MGNAAAGLCNPGMAANYINLPTLASCLAIGGGFATFAGGYNIIMLSKERQRADAAEERLQAARERYDRLMDELLEDRRQNTAAQQAMMTTLAEISAALTQLVQQQQNGRHNDGA